VRTVAALYVDPKGPYPKLEGVECWDAARDANKYYGPHPAVAHPPCAPWSKMRWLSSSVNRARDRACALYALERVRVFGGVLEHPEYSAFWSHARLPLPREFKTVDSYGGRSYYVNQLAWGHKCSKPTWLYVVGVEHDYVTTGVRFGGLATHCVTKGPGQTGGLKVAHAAMRSRSPIAFAEWLVSLARMSRA